MGSLRTHCNGLCWQVGWHVWSGPIGMVFPSTGMMWRALIPTSPLARDLPPSGVVVLAAWCGGAWASGPKNQGFEAWVMGNKQDGWQHLAPCARSGGPALASLIFKSSLREWQLRMQQTRTQADSKALHMSGKDPPSQKIPH